MTKKLLQEGLIMSRTINIPRQEGTITKKEIWLCVLGIIMITAIGFWASEIRGSLYYGSVKNFPYLLVPAALLGLSLTLTALFLFVSEKKFEAHDTWCMLLIFWIGMSFASWFIPLEIRILAFEFIQIMLIAIAIGILIFVSKLIKLAWTYKLWILGISCLVYVVYIIAPRVERRWVTFQKQRAQR